MKKILLVLLFAFVVTRGFSQAGPVVESNSKGLFVTHTVQPKENFYAIGRTYAISPKDIAAFNALDMSAGLNVGQTIQIPLTEANFSQTKATGTPVYYVVGEKEGLYRVSLKNNKVLMASLRKWNHLTSDNINPGQKLIVGYLQATGVPVHTDVAKTETAPQTTTTEAQPKSEPVQTKQEDSQPAPRRQAAPAETKPAPVAQTQKAAPVSGGAGYFKTQFEQQSNGRKGAQDATVTSGIFKTSSGFQDGKYYALMDKVEPGTIVQVVNPVNNKSIYAKVLGQMSGIRQNQGLELRISNAAATALDVSETDKFIVRVLY